MMAHQAPLAVNGGGGGGAGSGAGGGGVVAGGPAGLATAAPQKLELDELEKRHASLCMELNMDTAAMQASWQSFVSVGKDHTLEVSWSHPLSCPHC